MFPRTLVTSSFSPLKPTLNPSFQVSISNWSILSSSNHLGSFQNRSFANFDSRVVRFERYGSPQRVLKVEKETISSDKLSGSQVLLKVLAAPIHPGDISHIEGTVGLETTLPSVPGLEAVGQVLEVGSGSNFQRNDRVLVVNPRVGTWRTHLVTDQKNLKRLPKSLENVSGATFSVVPMIALSLLEEIVKLNPGDVIIQGCGESAVGRCVSQIAFARQLKVISVSSYGDQKRVDELKGFGATVALSAEQLHSKNTFAQLTTGLPKPKLALNPVGGLVALDLVRSLGPDGVFVTYGNMSKNPLQVPPSTVIFNNISLRGFSLVNWLETHTEQERNTIFEKVSKLWNDKTISVPTEIVSFPTSSTELFSALEKHNDSHREKKIVFSMEK